MKLLNIISVAALLGSTNAWSYEGHNIVARIAHLVLEKESPATIKQVETILGYLNTDKKYLTPREGTGSYIFTECATFADEIKRKGGDYQSDWHFHDEVYLDQGGDISDFHFKPKSATVTNAIKGIEKWFKQSSGYTNDYYYKTIHASDYPTGATERERQSIAMRFLIHYVGDQHQPLHSESRVDKKYDTGDRGGNDLPLPGHYSCNELHCVWDRVVYEFKKNVASPFTSDSYNTFTNTVSTVMKRHPVSSLDAVSNLDPDQWQKESFAIAKSFVYNGVQEGVALNADYVSQGKIIAEKRLVQAGYRLARVLKSLNLSGLKDEVEFEEIEAVKAEEVAKVAETQQEDSLFLY
jgi:hypothetical protein